MPEWGCRVGRGDEMGMRGMPGGRSASGGEIGGLDVQQPGVMPRPNAQDQAQIRCANTGGMLKTCTRVCRVHPLAKPGSPSCHYMIDDRHRSSRSGWFFSKSSSNASHPCS